MKKLITIMISAMIAIMYLSACSEKIKHGDRTKMSKSILLKSGQTFMVISSITRVGAEKLMKEYFDEVFPIASKHGFKPLANLQIDKVLAGEYKPNNFIGLYTWPDLNAVSEFLKELPQSELTSKRLKIWAELKQVYIQIKKDTRLTFKKDKVYQVDTLWVKENKDLSRYFEEMKDTLEKLGGKHVVSFKVQKYEDLNHGIQPTSVNIIEWPDEKSLQEYTKSKAYKTNAHYFNESMINVESFLTHLM